MNKKQKKVAPSEEDDSGVEVYYREGEEEMEEMSVLPKVRDSAEWERTGCAGEGGPWPESWAVFGSSSSLPWPKAGLLGLHLVISILSLRPYFTQGVGCIK